MGFIAKRRIKFGGKYYSAGTSVPDAVGELRPDLVAGSPKAIPKSATDTDQCAYIKKTDGLRCKNDAKAGDIYCKPHRKVVDAAEQPE